MKCEVYQNEIADGVISGEVKSHLAECRECRKSANLHEILGNLEKVSAPPNFNFRLTARWHKTQLKQKLAAFPHFGFPLVASGLAAVLVCLFGIWFLLYSVTAPVSEVSEVVQPAANKIPVSPSENFAGNKSATNSAPQLIVLKPDNSPQTITAKIAAPRKIEPKSKFQPATKADKLKTKLPDNAPQVAPPENKEILTSDSAIKNVPKSLTPKGIPDPLAVNKGMKPEISLDFFGIEAVSEGEKLRVTAVKNGSRADSSGVQKGDLIEKFNGKSPAEISTNNLPEIILVIRRAGKAQEIKLLSEPKSELPKN